VVAGAGETKGDWGKGTAEMKKNGEVSWNVTLNKGMGASWSWSMRSGCPVVRVWRASECLDGRWNRIWMHGTRLAAHLMSFTLFQLSP
jgi:hypothetical protein